MACFNRRDLTKRAIERAQLAADFAGVEICFTVFDDGSSDGTRETLNLMPQNISIIEGAGDAYWAASMAAAEKAALAWSSSMPEAAGDYLVWLNDDVNLDSDAFVRLLSVAHSNETAIVVGSMRDPISNEITYSGMRSAWGHPLKFELSSPSREPQFVDTFNGNLVLVPITVALSLGGIDGDFAHAFADIDYGLRAGRVGIPVILPHGTHGTCPRNPAIAIVNTASEWINFRALKGGGNYLSLRRILKKSHPTTWILFIVWTYSAWWIRRSIRAAIRRIMP